MKTIRIFLSAVAIVFAVGAAVASSFTNYPVAYQFVDLAGTVNDRCDIIEIECNDVSGPACRVTALSPILRRDNTPGTSCGPELKKGFVN